MPMFADRYELRAELGHAGGVVYEAYDTVLRTTLAVKLLAFGEDLLAVREASALRALSSDHILPVLNAGVHGDIPFVVTELASGGSVEGRLQAHPNGLDVGVALRWARQMLVGLEYCHRRGILHRDVTPNNIFLDNDDHARLGDFGAAANLGPDGYAARHGNQRVVAPEGYTEGRLTVRSEVFSTGVTLWRMLTGEWPYEAPTEDALHAQMVSGSRPRLRELAPHVPRSVARVVEQALSPVPEDRYASAADLREALASCQLTSRHWRPIPPHPTHERCWVGDFPAGSVHTCLMVTGRSASVVTKRENGRRISEGCFEARRGAVGPALRRLFDHL